MHKSKNLFFFLLQSELGDIYKVTLDLNGDEGTDVKVKYFDTIPVCSAMCVLKTGYLFSASEFGNHYLFTFKAIGKTVSFLL
jgi:splicing factor 3B subunit 3